MGRCRAGIIVLFAVFMSVVAGCGEPPTPLERTVAEGMARFDLTVARGPSVARSRGVVDFARRTAHVEDHAGLADPGSGRGRTVPLDIAAWIEGSSLTTDRRGRIVRVVFHERDVVVTLVLSEFGTAVRSAPRGT